METRDLQINIEFELLKTNEKKAIDKDCGCDITYDGMANEILSKVLEALKTIDREGTIESLSIDIKDKKTDKSFTLGIMA